MTPADGDAFFTSAMICMFPGLSSAARKSRTGGASASRRSSSAGGVPSLAAATSRRLLATISSRMVPMATYNVWTFARPGPFIPDTAVGELRDYFEPLLPWAYLAVASAPPVAALAYFRAGRKLGPQRHRAVPWTGGQVVAAFVLYLSLPVAFASYASLFFF